MQFVYLAIAIVAEVAATTALKASAGFKVPLPSAIVVVGFAVSFYFLSLTLKTMSIGIAYAIWSGVGLVLISLAAWWLYGQTLDAAALAGMALIAAGVAVINLFSQSVNH
jgi:small multidrug resistance pump